RHRPRYGTAPLPLAQQCEAAPYHIAVGVDDAVQKAFQRVGGRRVGPGEQSGGAFAQIEMVFGEVVFPPGGVAGLLDRLQPRIPVRRQSVPSRLERRLGTVFHRAPRFGVHGIEYWAVHVVVPLSVARPGTWITAPAALPRNQPLVCFVPYGTYQHATKSGNRQG